jgi:hypothetical protein
MGSVEKTLDGLSADETGIPAVVGTDSRRLVNVSKRFRTPEFVEGDLPLFGNSQPSLLNSSK